MMGIRWAHPAKHPTASIRTGGKRRVVRNEPARTFGGCSSKAARTLSQAMRAAVARWDEQGQKRMAKTRNEPSLATDNGNACGQSRDLDTRFATFAPEKRQRR